MIHIEVMKEKLNFVDHMKWVDFGVYCWRLPDHSHCKGDYDCLFEGNKSVYINGKDGMKQLSKENVPDYVKTVYIYTWLGGT